jgi:hypothetical protein
MQLACAVDGQLQRCATACQTDTRAGVLRVLSTAPVGTWLACTRSTLFDDLVEFPGAVARSLVVTLEIAMRQHEAALAKLMVCVYVCVCGCLFVCLCAATLPAPLIDGHFVCYV